MSSLLRGMGKVGCLEKRMSSVDDPSMDQSEVGVAVAVTLAAVDQEGVHQTPVGGGWKQFL